MSTIRIDQIVLEGELSVRAAIGGGRRNITEVLVDLDKKKKRDRKVLAFLSFLDEKNVKYTLLPRKELDEAVKNASEYAGNTHGGIAAFAMTRQYLSLDALFENVNPRDYFVCLDGIEDPYNLGYAIRSFYAMGAAGILLPERDYTTLDAAMLRSSAGASDLCRIALMPKDDGESAAIIEKAGLDIVCSAKNKISVPLGDFSPTKPFVLFIGGEKRGISPTFMDKAKTVVHIPYANESVRYSLPAVSVCAMYASHLFGFAAGD